MTWVETSATIASILLAAMTVGTYLRAVRQEQAAVGARLDAVVAAILELLHMVRLREGVPAGEMTSFREHLRGLLVRVVPVADNPLSSHELSRLRRYRDVLAERALTPEEAADLLELAVKAQVDHPRHAQVRALATGAALFAALVKAMARSMV